MKRLKTISLLCTMLLLALACKKEDNNPVAAEAGTVKLIMTHRWDENNTTNFLLDIPLLHPSTNDTLTFTTFKYYLSNVRLKRTDGTWWIHPESYFLIDLSDLNSSMLTIPNVPIGTYSAMEYTLGVDSLRNISGAQGGALSISNNMFWSWNTGYIMTKAEGISNNSSSGSFSFHLAGFEGADNIVTKRTFDFITQIPLTVKNGKVIEVHYTVNPMHLWDNSPSVSVLNNIATTGNDAKKMAKAFYNSIVFDHFHE
ncbi:MAG: hypothetical protein KA521_01505 [Crocinitomicaceae bacterium]|nr:hypothetical protein [Crocinitomicaceae bacterium]